MADRPTDREYLDRGLTFGVYSAEGECGTCIDARNAPEPQAADFCLKHRNCSTCGDRMQLDYLTPTQPWCSGCELPEDHCSCSPNVHGADACAWGGKCGCERRAKMAHRKCDCVCEIHG